MLGSSWLWVTEGIVVALDLTIDKLMELRYSLVVLWQNLMPFVVVNKIGDQSLALTCLTLFSTASMSSLEHYSILDSRLLGLLKMISYFLLGLSLLSGIGLHYRCCGVWLGCLDYWERLLWLPKSIVVWIFVRLIILSLSFDK